MLHQKKRIGGTPTLENNLLYCYINIRVRFQPTLIQRDWHLRSLSIDRNQHLTKFKWASYEVVRID